jgi:hypothetical protein
MKTLHSETQGFRPRVDQVETMKRLMELDLELDWSMAIRRGLDLFFAEKMKQQAFTPQVLQSLVSARGRVK